MKYEDFEIGEIPYWCRSCDAATPELLELPEGVSTDLMGHVCEVCYNVYCNEELESIRERPLRDETDKEWVDRCNAVSEKYGFGADHEFCQSCGCPQPHEPDCIECSKEIPYLE